MNPSLAGASGIFGARAASIKFGILGGLAGSEYLIARPHHSRKLWIGLAIVNFGSAAVFAAAAAHNYRVRGQAR